MNPLLARQLRKHQLRVDPSDPTWQAFLAAVDTAYSEFQADHAFVEHTLEVTSAELTEANDRLRRESEKQLSAVVRYYQQVLDFQQGMILSVVKAPAGFCYKLCRGQLLQRLGFESPAEIEGKFVEDVAGPAQVALLNEAFGRAWNGQAVTLGFATQDGVELFVLMRPRLENGVVQEIIAACIEVTALKDAERQMRAAKERAEAADRAKSEFLAVMSHEIRTPLNAVLGFSDLLRESELTDEQRARVDIICTAGESLLTLIDDILDFSKIEAGQLSLHPEPLALPSILDSIVTLFASRAVAKGLTLTKEIAPDVPTNIEVDIHRLRQILVNLVGNALKFTAQGGVAIYVQLAEPAAGPTCRLRFAVTDTGIGIPLDRRDRLFKPFSQVDSSMTRHYGGTGLGLAISDRLSRLLGGEIGFESEPGRGSTFHFTIRVPVVVLRPFPVSAASIPEPEMDTSLRILVAEDQRPNQLLIVGYLRSRGFEPDLVENGRLAIEAAARTRYDLVLMDLLMPEVDGYAAAEAIIRQTGCAPPPRIVALSANAYPEDRERCRAAGMIGLLAKPLNFRLLDRVLAGGAPDLE